MSSRISALVVWALAAGLILFWALPFVPSTQAPAARLVSTEAVANVSLARLLGSAPVPVQPAAPAASSRFQLLGLIAPRAGVPEAAGEGVALLAIDGKPARAFRVGANLDGEWILQAVTARSVSVSTANGANSFQLDLPPLPAVSTGAMPPPPPGLTVQTSAPLMPGGTESGPIRLPLASIPNVMPVIGAPPLGQVERPGVQQESEEEEEEEEESSDHLGPAPTRPPR